MEEVQQLLHKWEMPEEVVKTFKGMYYCIFNKPSGLVYKYP